MYDALGYELRLRDVFFLSFQLLHSMRMQENALCLALTKTRDNNFVKKEFTTRCVLEIAWTWKKHLGPTSRLSNMFWKQH